MVRVLSIERLPENFPEFIEEIAAGLMQLYGPRAAQHYRRTAARSIQAALTHPSVRGIVAVLHPELEETGTRRPVEAAGLLIALTRQQVGQISLVHVLRRCRIDGVENALVSRIVEDFREEGVEGIVCEPIPMTPMDLDSPFIRLGFRKIERLLMQTEINMTGLARPSLRESTSLTQADLPELAEVIVDAYTNHPGRYLHSEVRSFEGALVFVQSALEGGYGPTRASFSRVVRRNGRAVAGIVGSEIAPRVGFILQVVVRRDHQGRGLGTLLLREVAQCFHESGFDRMGLGVTATNPARRLYERLGFRPQRAVNAYVWWKPDAAPISAAESCCLRNEEASPGCGPGNQR